MTAYSLEEFAKDIRQTLKDNPGDDGPGKACPFVERALADRSFLAEHFGADKPGPRHVIYEDPDYGFCVCVHVYHNANNGEPHDHGPSWAIYGQVEGTTEMTHWRIVEPAKEPEPIRVEQTDTLVLKPGMAHFYRVGDVHAPNRAGPVKLLRIEGVNLDGIQRSNIKPVSKAQT